MAESKEALAPFIALREPFPPESINQIPKGGTVLDYVGHAWVTDRLLSVDETWTWEPLAFTDEGAPLVKVHDGTAVMWIRLTVCGVTRLGVGTCRTDKSEVEKELIGDAIRNAAMRFGVALDLWKKETPSEQGAAPRVERANNGGPRPTTPAPSGAGDPDDPWRDVLLNPDGWFYNEPKKGPDGKWKKGPRWKAKRGNTPWGTAGDWPEPGSPMGLFETDAPPNFADAFAAGDPSLYDLPTEPKAKHGKTVAVAVEKLGGEVVAEGEPPEGEEPF